MEQGLAGFQQKVLGNAKHQTGTVSPVNFPAFHPEAGEGNTCPNTDLLVRCAAVIGLTKQDILACNFCGTADSLARRSVFCERIYNVLAPLCFVDSFPSEETETTELERAYRSLSKEIVAQAQAVLGEILECLGGKSQDTDKPNSATHIERKEGILYFSPEKCPLCPAIQPEK